MNKIIFKMPIMKDYHMLSVNKDVEKNIIMTFMTYITEEDEKVLDKGEVLHLVRGDMEFNITPKKVYCYGHVDFTKDSSDYNIISDFDFLNFLNDVGIHIPSDYNYKTHECCSPINRIRWTETWNPAEVAQYAHARLGKPERIVLFRHTKEIDRHGKYKFT